MTEFAFMPPTNPTVPIVGTTTVFPVRRILCVGRNYAAHRREMGGDDRDPPFFFAKPPDAVITGGHVPYPSRTSDLHHEVELVIALGAGGVDIAATESLEMVFGWAVGVDLTRRDLQGLAKAKGQPWSAAKGFDHSAPMSPIRRQSGPPPESAIRLSVNGELRQSASLLDMLWTPAEIIAEASRLWRLAAGDLIFTGTPEGVGPLVKGDRVEAAIEDVGDLRFSIV